MHEGLLSDLSFGAPPRGIFTWDLSHWQIDAQCNWTKGGNVGRAKKGRLTKEIKVQAERGANVCSSLLGSGSPVDDHEITGSTEQAVLPKR